VKNVIIANLFNADPDKKSTIELLTRQCSLVKLAKILVIFKLWHKEDITFAKNLYDIRNATAYKNPKKIADKVTPGRNISLWDINKVLSDHPVSPYLIMTIRLLFKLMITTFLQPTAEKNHRGYWTQENYSEN
jgi:hypothetical protein